MRYRVVLLVFALVAALFVATPANAEHGTNPAEMSPNMVHLANRQPTPPTGPPTTNSDLAFWGAGGLVEPYDHIVAVGNYDGFRIFDIGEPSNPTRSRSRTSSAARIRATCRSTRRMTGSSSSSRSTAR